MGEVIPLQNAALPAFLKEAKYSRFSDAEFFRRMINFAIQYGGMEPHDIADLNGLSPKAVIKWKEDAKFAPRVFMRRAVCRELKEVLVEVARGRSAREVINERLGD